MSSDEAGPADLDTVADELYGLRLDEFVPTRGTREKEARARGDRQLAEGIRGMGKPTVVAWLANQLVRERPGEITDLLALGEHLREATAVLSGDELRRLSGQQQRVLNALVAQARRVAGELGERVSDSTARGLEDTLRAALADPGLARQLESGRLTTALQYVGFGAAAGEATPGTESTSQPTRPPRTGMADGGATGQRARAVDEERLAALRGEVADSHAEAERAAAEVDQARADLDEAEASAGDLAETAQRLRAELARTVEAQEEAQNRARQARGRHRKAERAADEARRRLEAATRQLDRLTERHGSGR